LRRLVLVHQSAELQDHLQVELLEAYHPQMRVAAH
jgi:hypothetical protein